ncbi:coiled-coil domain-containing protein 14 isoform X2 [Larimichthys crocea]|uniref:coiled-coil domain-containing protein 14 isoform X2 n=1 Tax=Larimichthys crocea TaxID=215358 RepID=UPI000F5FB507|nr:coiled-coil domain-containing protein 14 isoform X2 [Larimichthys crocea]
MKGTAKSKVVTSGRLTGRVKVQPVRRRVTPNPGPAAGPEPAYSLYSTDSEDQVTSLHKGLDRCAALLSGILQAEQAEALPSLPKAVKGGAAKSRPSTSVGKKSIKKLPPHTDQKRCESGGTTPRTRRPAVPAAHSGVKLHPALKKPQTPLQSHFSPPVRCQTLQHLTTKTTTTTPPLQPQTPTPDSGRLPLPQTDCDGEEDFVPVRDTAADAHTHSPIHTCTWKMSDMQLEPGPGDQDTHSRGDCSAETEVQVKTVQYLLGELKALIAGQGSVAEKLLSHLEYTVSSSLMTVGTSNTHTEPDLSSLYSQNTQLRRRVKILNQQLKERERAERQENTETLCNSEVGTLRVFTVPALQEELTSTQCRLQEVQDELTEVRKALQDTQSQLRDRETQNTVMETDLEATRRRLLDSEREKIELASLAQQRLEEIGCLNRTLQMSAADSSVSVTHRQNPAEPTADRISQYLLSLGQCEHVCVAADGEQSKRPTVQLRDTSSRPTDTSARHPNSHLDQSRCFDKVQSCGRRLETSTLSQCDMESVWSECSAKSASTFDTRDEAAFRDGLSALDASIASLQKTLQLDLRR